MQYSVCDYEHSAVWLSSRFHSLISRELQHCMAPKDVREAPTSWFSGYTPIDSSYVSDFVIIFEKEECIDITTKNLTHGSSGQFKTFENNLKFPGKQMC